MRSRDVGPHPSAIESRHRSEIGAYRARLAGAALVGLGALAYWMGRAAGIW